MKKPLDEPAAVPANNKVDKFIKKPQRIPPGNNVTLSSKNLLKFDLEQAKMDVRKREIKKMSKKSHKLYKSIKQT